ncbi:MAG: helix-turn-helix domain-containing protein [Longimicrobiales bacterium]
MSAEAEKLLYKLIGERVRTRRAGLTQTDLAKRVGLGRTSITNLESGTQRMPLHYLVRIAEALDCDVCELVPSRKELQDGGAQIVLGSTGKAGKKTDQLIKAHLAKVGGKS